MPGLGPKLPPKYIAPFCERRGIIIVYKEKEIEKLIATLRQNFYIQGSNVIIKTFEGKLNI